MERPRPPSRADAESADSPGRSGSAGGARSRSRSGRVSVGLIGGEEVVGDVEGYSPLDEPLTLAVADPAAGEPAKRSLPTQSIAYVAFWRTAGSAPQASGVGPEAVVRVHLDGHRTLLVEALTDPQDPNGFWSMHCDHASPLEWIFFYAHGIRHLERDEPVGSILVREGMIESADLERGLDRQNETEGRSRLGEILLERQRVSPEELGEAVDLQKRRRLRLGEVLIEAGLVTREDVEAALREQRSQRGGRLGDILVEMQMVEPTSLARTLATKFHLPFVDLDACEIDPRAPEAIPSSIIEKHGVLPIALERGEITIAVSDPLNAEPIDLIRFHRSERIREVVVVPTQLAEYVNRYLSYASPAAGDDLLRDLEIEARTETFDADVEDADGDDGVLDSDNAVIQLANQILVEAVQRRASDVHIEPNGPRGGVGVRFRVDGDCVSFVEVPSSYRHALVSRLKIMANLDISERRKPQDGRIRIRASGRTVELRVATIPTMGGEDVVLRVLASSKPIPLDEMELSERNRRELERLIRMPYGLVLCVGPTGSGKSTSLHSLLGEINSVDRKIWTAEDPVEITQRGLRQVQVRSKIGFGFAEALRAFLRADPDVIMVGEMRDLETAGIVTEAALTGHLVFSTLHTNSAPETVVRLVEMGIDPFVFGDALLGVLAQRLARRLCEACRSLEPASDADRDALTHALGPLAEATPVGQLMWRARGCERCHGTGYWGRIALHELLVVDPSLRSAIHARQSADAIRELAVAGGMTTLLQDGAAKCLTGATDLKQVLAVCAR